MRPWDARLEKYDGFAFGCGQCLACRINRRRVWTLRLMLESYYHEKTCFVTLTYRDDDLPFNLCSGLPFLEKRDCQLWLKRLRKQFHGTKIRYYLAGEYGAKTKRPHYHAIIFGLSAEDLDPEWALYEGHSGGESGFAKRVTPLSKTWPYGKVQVGEATRESMQYTAGYVTKKLTKKGDGYVPEFSLMSRKPGIGASAVADIASAFERGAFEKTTHGVLRLDGKVWSFGRFLQQKLSECGFSSALADGYLLELREKWKSSRRLGVPFLEYLVQLDEGKFKVLEARDKIFNTRSSL